MDKPEIIGARLKALRLALGFHQARAFCTFIGAHEPNWNMFERGHRRISLDEAVKVVIKTGVSLDWIYLGREHTLPLHIAEKLRQVDA
jgi:transcriptional regulator with XRE-family HTH domain